MRGVVSKSALLAHARSAAKHLAEPEQTAQARADVCLDLLSEIGVDERLHGFRRALHALPMDERHYWVGTLYTLLLPRQITVIVNGVVECLIICQHSPVGKILRLKGRKHCVNGCVKRHNAILLGGKLEERKFFDTAIPEYR